MDKKVLVIDDDPYHGKLVEASLRSFELAIYQAHTGGEGLQVADTIRPDLVILDVMLPDIDGFEVCTRLRDLTSIPILMLTAHATENSLSHSFDAGADDFMKKPFSKNEFQLRVNSLLARSNPQNSSEAACRESDIDDIPGGGSSSPPTRK